MKLPKWMLCSASLNTDVFAQDSFSKSFIKIHLWHVRNFFSTAFLHAFLKPACFFLVQVSRSWCGSHGRRSAQYPSGAHSVPDAAHCPTDCCWYGVPGLAAFCPQRLGNKELSGRRKPAGQDRRLWHVQGHLQHGLLQSEYSASLLLHFVTYIHKQDLLSKSFWFRHSSTEIYSHVHRDKWCLWWVSI